MANVDPADLELALALCDRADVITTAAYRRTDLVVERKADRSPVSEADREVELVLREALADARPADRILGEEFGGVNASYGTGGPARRWIIDPIDGTANFIRRMPVWATLLALEVEGAIVAGVVSAPALGRRWWAGSGLGAFSVSSDTPQPRRIGVSAVADLGDAYVLGASLNYWDEVKRSPRPWLELSARASWDRTVGDFWTHMLVAEGSAEIGLDPLANLWDLAALKVIVEEAGGTFTSFDGTSRADGGNALSSNGLLHGPVLEVLGAYSD